MKIFFVTLALLGLSVSLVSAAGSASGGALPPEHAPVVEPAPVKPIVAPTPSSVPPKQNEAKPVEVMKKDISITSKLKCGDLSEMRDRAMCRLKLTPTEMARELELQYLPEECRAIQNQGQRTACIAHYKTYKPCWSVPVGEERFMCARTALLLGASVSDEIKLCNNRSGDAQSACKEAV